jgi:hypothetical protein
MAIEQKWPSVAPQAFTADGGQQGQIKVADVRGFKVKQNVVISATGLPDLNLQVKRVVKKTGFIRVGPPQDQQLQGKAGLAAFSDISAYTVVLGAFLYAAEQPKVRLKTDDIDSATYEQEPTVARRVVGVDQYGDFYDQDNPLPVAFDGDVTIGVVEVKGTNGNFVEPNSDGSINVNVVEAPVAGHTVRSIFGEITSVPNGSQTQITFYTVPVSKTGVLERISVSGDNLARFDVYLNGTLFDTKRSWYGDFNAGFEFMTGTSDGFTLNAGDTISIKVTHNSPFLGSFTARIQVLEIA